MNSLFYERSTCRLCVSNQLRVALALASTPMGDKYTTYDKRHEVSERIPLDINMCLQCGHLQTKAVANPRILYRHYLSRPAAINQGLSEAYRSYAEGLLSRFRHGRDGFVVELGSNDGMFAKFLQDSGMRALGVEPALNLADQASRSGIATLPEFFAVALAKEIKKKHGSANMVIANHMFANVDDLDDMTAGIRDLLAQDGIFVMQTFYMRDVLQKHLLENFNHEHLSYFYVRSLQSFLSRHGMELFDVEHVPAKGGSIRCFMQLSDGPQKVSHIVSEMIRAEESIGMNRIDTYESIDAFIQRTRKQLQELVKKCKVEGKSVAAYGTSIGATTFTYQYGLGEDIKFYIDDDPYRQHLASPGYHIPVLGPEELYKQKPDYVVIMAPLYADNIMKKNIAYLRDGGNFVLIWPKYEIMSLEHLSQLQGI